MELKNKLKLNLGSGMDYRKGWINVDIEDKYHGKPIKKDVKWDLNKFPYPFKDSTFNETRFSWVLEHLDNPIKVLKEVIRISKNNGKIIIIAIHSRCYSRNSNLTIKHDFTENTFKGTRLYEYGLDRNLKSKSVSFVYTHKWKEKIPFKKFFNIFLSGLYDNIKFEFKVIK